MRERGTLKMLVFEHILDVIRFMLCLVSGITADVYTHLMRLFT